jgi:hypothetical protein
MQGDLFLHHYGKYTLRYLAFLIWQMHRIFFLSLPPLRTSVLSICAF